MNSEGELTRITKIRDLIREFEKCMTLQAQIVAELEKLGCAAKISLVDNGNGTSDMSLEHRVLGGPAGIN